MLVILLLLVPAVILLYWAIRPNNYWSKKHVPVSDSFSIFDQIFKMFLSKQSGPEIIQEMYNLLSNVRYLGIYQMKTPVLVLKSPEMIKQLCVKDFDHFLDHQTLFPDGVDELWSKNLFALRGHNWKTMRSTLSPSFTSSKMKGMFILMCENVERFIQYFLNTNEKFIEVELKDAYARYTNDVIASTSFGLKVDSLQDRENEFYLMGKEASTFTGVKNIFAITMYQICPAVAAFLRLPLFSDSVRSFFMNLVKDTIKLREEQNIKRPDMLGLLIEARRGRSKEKEIEESTDKNDSFAAVEEHLEMKHIKEDLTDGDIASQVFIFFLGGFETVSTAMCLMSYELALNPDVQKKLIEEIDENTPSNGAPSYETVANMTYLDMVVSETLRKYPVMLQTDRVVTKPYTIEPEAPEEKPVHLEVGQRVIVPIYAIHHDVEYYENPEKFDPERFSPENRKNLNPYAYLPFGVGPRNCIGSRFAILEMKALFFYMLRHFQIVPVEKTNIPLKYGKATFSLTSVNGFPLGLERRS